MSCASARNVIFPPLLQSKFELLTLALSPVCDLHSVAYLLAMPVLGNCVSERSM